MKKLFFVLSFVLTFLSSNAQENYKSQIPDERIIQMDFRWEGRTLYIKKTDIDGNNILTYFYNLTDLEVIEGEVQVEPGNYWLVPFQDINPFRITQNFEVFCYCNDGGGGSCTRAKANNVYFCNPHGCSECIAVVCFNEITGGAILVEADRVIIQK